MAALVRRPAAGLTSALSRVPQRRAVACCARRSIFDALDAMEADVAALERDAAAHGAEAFTERVDAGPGFRSYSRSYCRLIVAGPKPAADVRAPSSLMTGPVLAGALLLGAYVAVAARFARGFASTRFRRSRIPALVASWPLLVALSGDFRRELEVALKAAGKGEGGEADPPAPPPTPGDDDPLVDRR